MVSTTYLLLLIVSAAIPTVATILYISSVATSHWEYMTFDYKKLNTSGSFYITGTLLDRDSATHTVVGAVMSPVENSSIKDSYCLFNARGGIWETCDLATASTRNSSKCSTVEKVKGDKSCFRYVDFKSKLDFIGRHGTYMIKMQNNIISCAIVVLLCSIAAVPISLIGFLWKVVPAIMVTAVLFLVSGIFAVFGNIIVHEKLKRLSTKHGEECSAIFKVPEELCNSNYMQVEVGYSIIFSWLASFLYTCSCIVWFYLTRLMRMEKAKNML